MAFSAILRRVASATAPAAVRALIRTTRPIHSSSSSPTLVRAAVIRPPPPPRHLALPCGPRSASHLARCFSSSAGSAGWVITGNKEEGITCTLEYDISKLTVFVPNIEEKESSDKEANKLPLTFTLLNIESKVSITGTLSVRIDKLALDFNECLGVGVDFNFDKHFLFRDLSLELLDLFFVKKDQHKS